MAGFGVQAALSRAASTMLRGRSSNLDAPRAERSSGSAASPRSPADTAPPATSGGAVTLVSAVEGPDGRLIMDSVQIATPAVVPVSNAANHGVSLGGTPAQMEGATDVPSRRRLQVGAEPAPDVRIEMVQPAQQQQQQQRSTTWVSPFANATFWPSSGSATNAPREQNTDEAAHAAGFTRRGADAV